MKIKKYKDLTLININKEQILVVSCDSSGGIGNKENDIVKTDPEIVGYHTAKVALMEAIALGAKPITIVDTLSVEMYNTGSRILKGIIEAVGPLNLDISNIITGSTEENFPVSVTGMGVTVISIIEKKYWIKPKTKRGLISVVVGLPKLGNEVLADTEDILSIQELLKLKEKNYIKEISLVGSKGILYELKEISRTNNIKHLLYDNIDIDIEKSSGPSTCAIVTIEESKYAKLKKECSLPLNKIGRFI